MDAQGKPGSSRSRADAVITARDEGTTRIVSLAGNVRLQEAEDLREVLPGYIGALDRHIVLDFDGLDFISSVGLSAILAIYRDVRAQHGTLVIARPQPSIDQLLRVTRVRELIPVVGTLPEACAAAS